MQVTTVPGEGQVAQTRMAVATIEFAADLYSVAAIMKAAYQHIDRLAVDLEKGADGATICRIALLTRTADPDGGRLDRAALEFKKSVLDQQLREMIREETKGVRNLILAHTFSRTGYADVE